LQPESRSGRPGRRKSYGNVLSTGLRREVAK
jgi:hypothetical protein